MTTPSTGSLSGIVMLRTNMRYMYLLVVITASAGCTSTRVVDTQAPSPYVEVNEAVQGRVVQVQLADGRTLRATDVDLAPDVASYVDADGQMHTVATDKIEQIRLTQHGRGALEGIGIGLLIGGAGGAMVGLASVSACNEGDLFCDPGFYAIAFGALFGAIGGAIGLISGTVRGHRTVYRFSGSRGPSATRTMPEATGARPPH
jgi:hypothetical protein